MHLLEKLSQEIPWVLIMFIANKELEVQEFNSNLLPHIITNSYKLILLFQYSEA